VATRHLAQLKLGLQGLSLSPASALQRFEAIGRWNALIIQRHGVVRHPGLASRNRMEVARESSRHDADAYQRGPSIGEAADHVETTTQSAT
jgi:hypothetical protein